MAGGGKGFHDADGGRLFLLVEWDEIQELSQYDGTELGMCLFDVIDVDGVGRGSRNQSPATRLQRCLSGQQTLTGCQEKEGPHHSSLCGAVRGCHIKDFEEIVKRSCSDEGVAVLVFQFALLLDESGCAFARGRRGTGGRHVLGRWAELLGLIQAGQGGFDGEPEGDSALVAGRGALGRLCRVGLQLEEAVVCLCSRGQNSR